MISTTRLPPSDADQLRARVEELEADRRRLLMVIELLRELAGSLDYRDIVHAVARRIGYALELDRCSVFLTEKGGTTVHLVASYEDPALRSQIIQLGRYPEIRQALETASVVNIPDVLHEPSLEAVQDQLAARRVQSITVIPIAWRRVVIGALFCAPTVPGPRCRIPTSSGPSWLPASPHRPSVPPTSSSGSRPAAAAMTAPPSSAIGNALP